MFYKVCMEIAYEGQCDEKYYRFFHCALEDVKQRIKSDKSIDDIEEVGFHPRIEGYWSWGLNSSCDISIYEISFEDEDQEHLCPRSGFYEEGPREACYYCANKPPN